MPIASRDVTVVKEGSFACGWSVTPEKCGLNDGLPGAHTFRYRVKLRASAMDRYGFVFDNRAIGAYFKDKYDNGSGSYVSCERMAQDAVAAFRDMIDRDGLQRRCTYAEVEISGFPEAWVIARYW